MRNVKPGKTSKGTALVFSLLILLVMTIVGIATMSNIHMQERMAGNVNVQAIAFEAASAGISEALSYGMAEWNQRECSRMAADVPWAAEEWSTPRGVNLPAESVQNIQVQYQLKADCLEDPAITPDPAFPTFVPPVQMFITSRGQVLNNGDVIANREIEVRIDDFRSDGLCAIRVGGSGEGGSCGTGTKIIDFDAAPSKRLTVDGAGGPAICAASQDDASEIAGSIKPDRLANYSGGVSRTDYHAPFDTDAGVGEMVAKIKAFTEFANCYKRYSNGGPLGASLACSDPAAFGGPAAPFTFDYEPWTAGQCKALLTDEEKETLDFYLDEVKTLALANKDFGIAELINGDNTDLLELVRFWPTQPSGPAGNVNFYGLNYVADDWTSSGNDSSFGMLVIEGKLRWNGKSNFDGFVLAVGGHFEMYGGGSGVTEGMLMTHHLDDLDDLDSSLEKLDLSGFYPVSTSSPVHPLIGGGIDPDFGIKDGDGIYVSGLKDFGFDELSCEQNKLDFSSGGGNHTINYSCRKFDAQRVFLKCFGLDSGWEDQGCNDPGRGASIQAIRSWRENLGWRELVATD